MGYTKKTFSLSLLLCLIALSLIGCHKHSHYSSKEKILRISFQTQPLTIDPRRNGDPFSSTLLFMLFEGLTHLESDGSVTLALAESVDISENLKIYTFRLKPSYWSDGIPLTAHDFERTWKKVLDPAFPSLSSHLFYGIKNGEKAKRGLLPLDQVGVRALDDKTLVVELEYPTPYFLELISFCSFFPIPSHVSTMHTPELFNPNKKFVCNGPYKISKWSHEKEIFLQKNPFFWSAGQIFLDKIHISIISHEMTALQMFEKGELDLLGGPDSPVPLEALPDLKKRKILRYKPIAGTMACAFNTKVFPFTNKNIRKALALAINRKEIIHNITQTNETIATGPIPPILKKSKLKHFFKDGDKEMAVKIFEEGLLELGIDRNTFPSLVLCYYANDLQHAIAQTLQDQWKKVLGIEIRLEKTDFKVFLDKITRKTYDLAAFSWIAQYFDPMNIFERFKHASEQKNYPGWENETYLRILNGSLQIKGFHKRIKLLEVAEKILSDEMPFAPIFHFNKVYLQNPHVTGLRITPIGNVDYRYIDINE